MRQPHVLSRIVLVGDEEQLVTCSCGWNQPATRDMDALRIVVAHGFLADVAEYMESRRAPIPPGEESPDQ